MSIHAIVGNAPLSQANKRLIAEANHVTRFNLAPNFKEGNSCRTDELYLSCSSKQIGELLCRRRFESNPVFVASKALVLPYSPTIIKQYMPSPSLLSRLKGRRADWTRKCLEIASTTGKPTLVLPATDYLRACRELEIDPQERRFFPSSGIIAVLRSLSHKEHRLFDLHLFGFSFEGWKRHRWDHEKAFMRDCVEKGLLTLH